MSFKLTVLDEDETPRICKLKKLPAAKPKTSKSKAIAVYRADNPPPRVTNPDLSVLYYRDIVRDQYGEILVPDETGSLLRLIDLCLLISNGKSISDSCVAVGVHPIRFMSIRDRFPEVDGAVRAAMELAGEEDISRATRIVEAMEDGNLPVSREKVSFFVWRGKNRYRRMYGEVRNGGVDINMSRNTTVNTFELNATIREMEKKETHDITLKEEEFKCED